MTTYRIADRRRWTSVSNDLIEDDSLSFRARGLLVWLLSKPDTWTVKAEVICSSGREGRDAVRTALQELEAPGYIRRGKHQDPETGRWSNVCTIYEAPNHFVISDTPKTDFQAPGNQASVFQASSSNNGEAITEQQSSSLRSEEELDAQVREHTPVAEPEPEIAKEFWDWHVADRGKEPVTKFMALRSVAKVLQKRGYGRDEIIDAMKTARLMTAKSLSDEIAAKRHAAEGTVNTAAIPQALVRAWVRAKPWIKGKVDASDETLDYWLRCCAAQMRFGYGVGETMIRFAVALRANNVTSFGLTDVQGVDRFVGELADYPDAMERAWRNRYWRAS